MPALTSESPAEVVARRRAAMELVRSTGARGGRIDPHRAIATIDLTAVDVALAAALATLTTVAYALVLPSLGAAWTRLFAWLAGPLGLGRVVTREASVGPFVRFAVPAFTAGAAVPTRVEWWVGLLVTLLALLATVPMRGRRLPLAYAVRFAAAVQCTALLFFALSPARFPYDLAVYVWGMMAVGAMVIGIVPLLLGLTFYLIDVSWSRKVGLTLLTMAHLAVLVPLQYALQSAIIVRASLLVMPLCFVLFALLPEVMVLVALFGWGMSWEPGRARGRRQ